MKPKLNYQMKHTVTCLVENIKNYFKGLVTPKPDITIFTDVSEIDWGITDGLKEYILMWFNLKLPL